MSKHTSTARIRYSPLNSESGRHISHAVRREFRITTAMIVLIVCLMALYLSVAVAYA